VSPGLRSGQFHGKDATELAGDWGWGTGEDNRPREAYLHNVKIAGIMT
jgi:hypothetical protein